jgi:hypothetical protein
MTTRRLVLLFALAGVLVGRPQEAWAKQDWWGWLEEFSGPGPFHGFELSAEIMCINLAQREQVPVAAYENLFARLRTSRTAVGTQLTMLAGDPGFPRSQIRLAEEAAELSAESAERRLARDVEALQKLIASGTPAAGDVFGLAVEIDATLRLLNAKVDGGRLVDAARDFVAFSTRTASLVAIGAGEDGRTKAATKREFTKPAGVFRSCREAQNRVDAQRTRERDRLAAYTATGAAPPKDVGSADDLDRLVIDRRDWQTGIVVNAGAFWSIENRLFDPQRLRDDEPQLQVIPVEMLAHSKLSSSIDVGAGVGVAFFRTAFRNDEWAHTKPAAFYVVPLSVVIRPARLFTNAHWASTFGYRVSARYFGDLTAADFGNPAGDFRQHGEFVWGAAGFVDFIALFGK